jgi:uncharacterized protein (TIRG00374 family)
MNAPAKPHVTKRILIFVGIGLAALVLYLYYLGTVNVAAEIEKTNLLLYASAFVAFLASVTFYSIAWQGMLRNLHIKIRTRQALVYAWAGMFFDAIVPDPGWSGDLSKAYMLSKASGQEAGGIVASVVGQKIIIMAVTIVDLLLGLVLLGLNYALPSNVLVFITAVLLLTVSALLVLVYLSTHESATGKLLNWLVRVACFIRRGHWDPQDFRAKAERTLNRFHEGIRTLTANPKALVQPVAFSLLSWALDISITFLAFASLGYPVAVDKVLIVYALTGSLQAMGASFLGFTEIIVSGSYAILGIPAAISVSATLLIRVVTLWFKLVVSYFVFQWAGIGLLLGKTQEAVEPKKFNVN